MIFVIQTIGDVSGLDIVEALSRAGISHVILSKQNDDAAQHRVQADEAKCTPELHAIFAGSLNYCYMCGASLRR